MHNLGRVSIHGVVTPDCANNSKFQATRASRFTILLILIHTMTLEKLGSGANPSSQPAWCGRQRGLLAVCTWRRATALLSRIKRIPSRMGKWDTLGHAAYSCGQEKGQTERDEGCAYAGKEKEACEQPGPRSAQRPPEALKHEKAPGTIFHQPWQAAGVREPSAPSSAPHPAAPSPALL